jgi:signal transduction histidine kinase
MPAASPTAPATGRPARSLWLGYTALALLAWLLHAAAGTDWERGSRSFLEGLYEATWQLGPGLLLGPLVYPGLVRLQARRRPPLAMAGAHALGAAVFALGWLGLDYAAAAYFFGTAHAAASLEQGLVWRSAWALVVYAALVFGFGSVIQGRRAQREALRAAQAEAALVRAELAAIQGKLDPHFLFNTLNSILMLTRRDAARAESALLGFSRLMRYVLDRARGDDGRVALRDELAFVRDYLALEQLRLGERLRVDWQLDPAADDDELPPLTLQPLVENAVLHGIAPRREGGTITVQTRRSAQGLHLRVADDGAGCNWPPPAAPSGRGVGLAALQRRFELDYDGRARLEVRTAPGQGFTVEILIP